MWVGEFPSPSRRNTLKDPPPHTEGGISAAATVRERKIQSRAEITGKCDTKRRKENTEENIIKAQLGKQICCKYLFLNSSKLALYNQNVMSALVAIPLHELPVCHGRQKCRIRTLGLLNENLARYP
jgi:hypothetical protein